MCSYKKYATQSHPQNLSEDIGHLPGLSKSKIWQLVNEAYDVLSNLIYSVEYQTFHFYVVTGNPDTKDVFDRYGGEVLKSGTTYSEPYVYHGDPMKTYK